MTEPQQQVPATPGTGTQAAIPHQPQPSDRPPLAPSFVQPAYPQPTVQPGQPYPPPPPQQQLFLPPPPPVAGPHPPTMQIPPGYQPVQGFPPGYPVAPPQPVRPRRSPLRVLSLLAVGLLVAAAFGWQMYQITRLSDRVENAQADALAARQSADAASAVVASRVAELEKISFQPDKLAAMALPSVFRVKAGAFSGTAWAVGKPTAGGGTYLFTNFHVVESVWEKGERKVGIEHKDLHFDATIVKVDKDKDVAQLETTAKFTGLAVGRDEVRPGEPIIVVGAPLGLESSVTTGVVSAFRKMEGTDDTYVQFDAPINPGNSGGPVINSRGQVVGIASAKLRDAEGIGLAIPIGLACDLFPICG